MSKILDPNQDCVFTKYIQVKIVKAASKKAPLYIRDPVPALNQHLLSYRLKERDKCSGVPSSKF